MIILDTHLWDWLADENERPTEYHRDIIEEELPACLGVSAISGGSEEVLPPPSWEPLQPMLSGG